MSNYQFYCNNYTSFDLSLDSNTGSKMDNFFSSNNFWDFTNEEKWNRSKILGRFPKKSKPEISRKLFE